MVYRYFRFVFDEYMFCRKIGSMQHSSAIDIWYIFFIKAHGQILLNHTQYLFRFLRLQLTSWIRWWFNVPFASAFAVASAYFYSFNFPLFPVGTDILNWFVYGVWSTELNCDNSKKEIRKKNQVKIEVDLICSRVYCLVYGWITHNFNFNEKNYWFFHPSSEQI